MKHARLLAPLLILTISWAMAARPMKTWLERAKADPKTEAPANPLERDADAVSAGAKLYQRYCSSCHGSNAQGLGRNPSLRSLRVKDATAGELFWLLRDGSLRRGMPSWSNLPPEQRWQLVAWMKSL